jgi:hypothetical protein
MVYANCTFWLLQNAGIDACADIMGGQEFMILQHYGTICTLIARSGCCKIQALMPVQTSWESKNFKFRSIMEQFVRKLRDLAAAKCRH